MLSPLLNLFGINFDAIHNNLIRNFERFGAEFGASDIYEFEEMARKFYADALHNGRQNSLYSIVILPKERFGIDYNGQYRAIYEKGGKPIAFFRPSYRDAGYNNKQQELSDWKSGRNSEYYARAPAE